MSFPEKPYPGIAAYLDDYAGQVGRALASVDRKAMEAATAILDQAISQDRRIFSCGNGGSAAISNHLVCDHAKGLQSDTLLRPQVQSLSATVELMTAIANDISYAEVFAYQIRTFGREGDVLITISSSGDSENVVRATQWARSNGLRTIALTGFEGGRTRHLAEVALHVDADNYGVVEDVHQSLMHILAQFLRQRHMDPELVAGRRF